MYSRNIEGIEPFGLDWCYEHGVQPETVKRFEEYQKAAVAGPVSLNLYQQYLAMGDMVEMPNM